ncbi:uncharacterized protein G2W53_002254 [Senna tora]|uniref:Uncharacterized protein n=1 Tax=Senna tora TaxID=362788 RepID=A0A834XHH5_9FABA|nr:uncharacterized protein G2W53_002254 [Senna tora]
MMKIRHRLIKPAHLATAAINSSHVIRPCKRVKKYNRPSHRNHREPQRATKREYSKRQFQRWRRRRWQRRQRRLRRASLAEAMAGDIIREVKRKKEISEGLRKWKKMW